MKITIIAITILLMGQIVHGQTDSLNLKKQSNSNYQLIEIQPKFNGGIQAISKIIRDSTKYPKQAFKDRIGGEILIQFTIDTLGNVNEIKIIKGIREDLNNEAIRLISLLKDWTPGTQNGKKVKVRFTFPLKFFPDEKFEKKYKKKHGIK